MSENSHILAFLVFAGLTIFRQVLYFRHQHQQKGANRKVKPVVVKDKVGSQLLAILYTVTWLGTAFELYRGFRLPWYVAGMFLIVAGMGIRQKALKDLGSSYGHEIVLRSNHKFVTHGVYSLIRHPLYLALSVELLGMALISQALWIFIVWLMIVVVLFRRVKLEDRALVGLMGEEAREYQSSTPAVNVVQKIWNRRNSA